MLPMFPFVAHKPRIAPSFSGFATVWAKDRILGQVKDCINPLIDINKSRIKKALHPYKYVILTGTNVNYIAHKIKAIQRVLIGFKGGEMAIIKLPIPKNISIAESINPIYFSSIPIYYGNYDLQKEYEVLSAWTLEYVKKVIDNIYNLCMQSPLDN